MASAAMDTSTSKDEISNALLWVDKHRPRSLEAMDYQPQLSERLKKIGASKAVPHLMFVGPSGAGKKTRVLALLREIYGPGVESARVETKSVVANPNNPSNTVDIQVLTTNHHLELSPSDAGNKDRVIVMQLIKEVASHPPIVGHPFKIVVIDEAGSLTNSAQAALRRTMEKYMKTCRIILLCESVSKIIPPLRSRCLAIRIPAPSTEEIEGILMKTAAKEQMVLPPELGRRIAESSGRDVRRALLMLESTYAQTPQPAATTPLPQEAWEGAVTRVAQRILEEQSPKRAMEVRGAMYELLAACLPADFILKELLKKLLKGVQNDNCQATIIAAAAHFEATMRQGSKDIFHLEAFVLRFMAEYEKVKGK
jgi:replication factor C subunit 3/5